MGNKDGGNDNIGSDDSIDDYDVSDKGEKSNACGNDLRTAVEIGGDMGTDGPPQESGLEATTMTMLDATCAIKKDTTKCGLYL